MPATGRGHRVDGRPHNLVIGLAQNAQGLRKIGRTHEQQVNVVESRDRIDVVKCAERSI